MVVKTWVVFDRTLAWIPLANEINFFIICFTLKFGFYQSRYNFPIRQWKILHSRSGELFPHLLQNSSLFPLATQSLLNLIIVIFFSNTMKFSLQFIVISFFIFHFLIKTTSNDRSWIKWWKYQQDQSCFSWLGTIRLIIGFMAPRSL